MLPKAIFGDATVAALVPILAGDDSLFRLCNVNKIFISQCEQNRNINQGPSCMYLKLLQIRIHLILFMR